MQDELVDVVDIDNLVLRQVSKSQAHAEGLLHRCVVSQLIDSQGRWTLVQQASDRQDAGQFVSPVGGHVTAGESESEALKREAMEELGIVATQYRKIGSAILDRAVVGRHENHLFLVYEIYSDDAYVLNHESVGTELFTLEQLSAQLKSNPNKFGEAFHFVIKNFYPQLIAD